MNFNYSIQVLCIFISRIIYKRLDANKIIIVIIRVEKFCSPQHQINATYLIGDILTERHELDHYKPGNCVNLRIPLHSTTHSQLFIRYRAIKTWNSLPGDLHSASPLSSFRNKLKFMLHQQYVSAK